VAIVVLAITALLVFLPVKHYLFSSLEWIQSLGHWGPLVLVFLYILACLLLLPGWILTVGAGFLFGLGWGLATVWAGASLGAMAAFLAGRTLARDWITRRITGKATFQAVDEAVGREGFKFVLLLRLSPLFPFNLLNYVLGLTRISFGRYALATLLGILPGSLMYVYFGSAARSLAEVAAGGHRNNAGLTLFFWAGLVATIAVAVLITRTANRTLKAIQHEKEESTHA
jgi:uncharacterized membrane protein YdjX (TVP38/TMEM64 family)